MKDNEKLRLVKRYLLNTDIHVNAELTMLEHYVLNKRNITPEDVLSLYRARVRAEAFKEFATNLEKILYNNYRGG